MTQTKSTTQAEPRRPRSDHIRAMSESAEKIAVGADKIEELISEMRALAASPPTFSAGAALIVITYIYIYINKQIHIYIYIYMYRYISTYTHIQAQTKRRGAAAAEPSRASGADLDYRLGIQTII